MLNIPFRRINSAYTNPVDFNTMQIYFNFRLIILQALYVIYL
jgi:hypothetical protein